MATNRSFSVKSGLVTDRLLLSPYVPVTPQGLMGKGTGALTSITSAISAASNPWGIAVDPSGRYAYAVNSSSNTVSQYSINQSTGALTAMSTPTVATGTTPKGIAVDPTGKFVYVTNFGGTNITQYTIDQTFGATAGQLTQIAGTVTTDANPQGIAVDPTGRFVYVVNYSSSNVAQYSINQTTGVLTALSPFSVATTSSPKYVAVDPTGRFVYVAGGGNPGSVYQYSINQSTGALTSIGSINSGNTPTGIVVDPTGRFVYVGNDAASGVVYGFSINQSTGALISGIGTVSAGSYPAYVSVDPTGRYVYAANTNSNTVSQFAINQSTGALIPITSAISCGTIPFGITVDPTGRFLYTANYGSANVSQYMINNFSAGNFSAGVMTGTATSAQYADLAENYVSDQQYDYGIVLMIGGDEEVTIAAEDTQRLAGVVSQNPGYLMNSECEGKHVVAIALQGRTPVRVKGNVRKGDFLVSAGDGYAKATDNPRIGSIIGKSLESFDGQYGMVEAMVGRI